MSNTLTKNGSAKLDFLRGLAAQAVLVEHILTTTGKSNVYIGSFGVVVFFLLSGFLIHLTTLSAFEDGKFSLDKYFSKRFFRIFTLYIPVVILCFGIDCYVSHMGLPQPSEVLRNSEVKNFFASFFMLQQNVFSEILSQILGLDWARIKPYGSARPLWTVAIEWWTYIAYGYFFAYFFAKKSLPNLISSAGLIFSFSLVVIIFNSVSGIGHNLTFIWILGAIVGHVYYKWGGGWLRSVKLSVLLLMIVVCATLFLARLVHMRLSPMFANALNPYDFINVLIFTAVFMGLIVRDDLWSCSVMLEKFSSFIGNISYALYLVHFTLLSLLFSFGFLRELSILSFIIAFFCCNIIATILYYLIDRHHQKINLKFWRIYDGARQCQSK
jgi:peptidoglycan/LPS O-acetylase OafA/YrhL